MADIFISYSRSDSNFVTQLRTALEAEGRSVWVDTSDILPTSHWRQDITDAIEAASAVLFVLSPAWLASEVSQRELQYAVEMRKKLIPVVSSDVEHRQVNPALAEINWIFARPTDNHATALQQILFAIDTDLPYWREGSDILVRARQWEQNTQQPAYTLRGDALRQAEQWLAAGATKRPGPTALQISYITAGRRASAARQRTTIGALSVGIIITLILSIVASGLAITTNKQKNDITAQKNSLAGAALDNQARGQYVGNKIDLALLLAAAAYKEHPDAATRATLFGLVHQSPHLKAVLQSTTTAAFEDAALFIGFSADGNKTAFITSNKVTIDYAANSHPQVTFQPKALPARASDSVISGAFSSDGQLVATKIQGATSSSIILWNAETGAMVRELDGVTYETSRDTAKHDIAFSPDGRLIASAMCPDQACTTNQITIWDIATGKILTQIAGKYPLNKFSHDDVAFSADNTYLTFAESQDVGDERSPSRAVVWDVAHSAIAFSIDTTTLGGSIATVAFTSSPTIFAVVSYIAKSVGQYQVTFWDVTKHAQIGQPTVFSSIAAIENLEFDRHDNWMLVADSDHTVTIWNLDSGYDTLVFSEDVVNIRSFITAVGFAPDGESLAVGSEDGQVNSWSLAPNTSESPSATLTFTPAPDVAFSPDSTSLLYTINSLVAEWDITQGKLKNLVKLPAQSTPVALTVSHDGNRVAVSNSDKTIAISSRTTGKVEGTPWIGAAGGDSITSLAFSPDDRSLLSCDFGGTSEVCFLWDTQTHALTHTFGDPKHQLNAAALSPDGKSIALSLIDFTTANLAVEVVDLQTQAVTATLVIKGIGFELSWSPDSAFVGYVDEIGNVGIWKYKTAKTAIPVTKTPAGLLASFQFMATPPGADPHSQWLMLANGRSVEVWQVNQQSEASRYVDPLFFANTVNSASVSPNGRYVAASEFYPGLIAVYSLDPQDWMKQACSIANRNLTGDEWAKYVQPLLGKPYDIICPDRPVTP